MLTLIAIAVVAALAGTAAGFIVARRTRFARVELRGVLADHIALTGKPPEISLGYVARLEYSDDDVQAWLENGDEGGTRCSR